MTTPYVSDRHRTRVGPPLCGMEQHAAAWEVIKSWAEAGVLQPIPGWEGDLAEGYADILGIKREAVAV